MSLSNVDLSSYVLIGQYDLPEPTRTSAPVNSLLAQEVSAVTYNWNTDTLFVVGDGGTSIVQVTKTGELISSMTLAVGSSPQGTEFFDPEGLTYIGNGQFVMVEERDRQAVLFTYEAGGTLTRSATLTVDLGTFVQNIGIEGISYDPLSGGFIAVKETLPEGIFQTSINFAAGTATNGSPTTENSVNLFNPTLLNLSDFADVFALSNLATLSGQADYSHLLVLSQESGTIVNVDRSGVIYSSLSIVPPPGNPLTVPAQQHEGLTMDSNGYLYVVSENGGGDFDHPQMWVYAPSTVPNQAPTALALTNQINTIAENTSTATRLKVADVAISDDGLGKNNLTVSGTDAAFFEVDRNGLYIKAGTVLDFETRTGYSVIVNVDDPALGGTPDATANFVFTLTDVAVETPPVPTLIISEVAPWSSGNSPIGADWFEITNTGQTAVNISGWKMDDNSNAFGSAVTLNGITSIAPGESVIFIETSDLAGKSSAFLSTWFGANPPAGLQIGNYTGGGVGLSTGGDAVNLYNSTGVLQANVVFGASPAGTFPTFDNWAGLNNATVSQLSVAGVHGGFVAANDATEIGSPGSAGKLFVSEVAPWSSGNSPVGADWFEVTNTTARAVNIAGWKMDDSSGSFAASVPLSGITSIASGESVIFLEVPSGGNAATIIANFKTVWFGDNVPANLQIGTYSGGGVGLSTGGDAVNLYSSSGVLQTGVTFGVSPTGPAFPSFDNAAALNGAALTKLSAIGVNGGFAAINDANEIASPGSVATVNHAPVAADNILSSIAEDSGVRIISFASLTANDSKGSVTENAQSLTIISVGNATGGTVSISGTDVIFAPTHNFNGQAGFEYTVQDNGTTRGVNDFLSDVGAVRFEITPVNDAPDITPASFMVMENGLPVGTIQAIDPENDTFSFELAGGADQAFFSIDANTGALAFRNTPDFETPEDANNDNTYEIVVSATDILGAASTQMISVIVGNDANETGQLINGGNGNSVLLGATGNDTINGGNGKDSINGGDGNDSISSGNGNDILVGGRGNDVLNGDNGDDVLLGGAGIDHLAGGRGNDTLDGGTGSDMLSGGSGADTFVYRALSDRGANGDVITDFTRGSGGDVLNLHDLLDTLPGITNGTHDNAFADGFLRFTHSGSSTIVEVDSNGGGNEFITLVGLTNSILQQNDTQNYFL